MLGDCRAGEERKIINKNIRSYERIFLLWDKVYVNGYRSSTIKSSPFCSAFSH